jgi:hypothetical protein
MTSIEKLTELRKTGLPGLQPARWGLTVPPEMAVVAAMAGPLLTAWIDEQLAVRSPEELDRVLEDCVRQLARLRSDDAPPIIGEGVVLAPPPISCGAQPPDRPPDNVVLFEKGYIGFYGPELLAVQLTYTGSIRCISFQDAGAMDEFFDHVVVDHLADWT